MRRKDSLLQKINVLVRRFPKFFHHFGPKKFTSWQHLKCILLKEKLRCSYRRLLELLPYFGVKKIPERTTLIKFVKRLSEEFWNELLKLSSNLTFCEIGAIDSTGLSRSNASSYFVKRIDRDVKTQCHLQLSLYVAVKERKILSARLRAKPVHDNKEVPYLLKKSPCIAEINIMDKAYDSNKTHEIFRNKGKYSIIPARKGCKKGKYRKEMRDHINHQQYWQRNIIESINSAIKRIYGETLHGKHITTQRAETYSRLILYNIITLYHRLFHLSPNLRKI